MNQLHTKFFLFTLTLLILKIKNSILTPFRAFYELYPILTFNSIFILRKVKKN